MQHVYAYIYIYTENSIDTYVSNSVVHEIHEDPKTTMIKAVISHFVCCLGFLWLIFSCEVTIHSPVTLTGYQVFHR